MTRKEPNLRLKREAAIFYDDAGCGLCLGENCRRAKNIAQSVILQAMDKGVSRPETLAEAVLENSPEETTFDMAALAVAEFILDFEPFLSER